jgi:hypothetical protein
MTRLVVAQTKESATEVTECTEKQDKIQNAKRKLQIAEALFGSLHFSLCIVQFAF